MSVTIAKVGFIGLGNQGGPMAGAVARAGFKLNVWARRPSSLAALAAVPHTVRETVAELAASSELIALCLRNDDDVWDVLKNQKMLENISPGTIIVNHGTGDPAEAERIAKHVNGMSGVYLDAPVSGGNSGADARKLTVFASGPAEAFETARHVFAAFGDTVKLLGAVGAGQLAKLFNNALAVTNTKNIEDVLGLAAQLRMNLPALIEVITVSSGGSTMLQALYEHITPELAEHLRPLAEKDMHHFADAVRTGGGDPTGVLAYGLAGAAGLAETARVLTTVRKNT